VVLLKSWLCLFFVYTRSTGCGLASFLVPYTGGLGTLISIKFMAQMGFVVLTTRPGMEVMYLVYVGCLKPASCGVVFCFLLAN
jgi:hypothetical protein